MKTTRLILVFLLAVGLSGCSTDDDPAGNPDGPQVPKPEFKEVNTTMEENIEHKTPKCYYSYFLFQNDSDHTLWYYWNTKYSQSGFFYYYVRPGEQATSWEVMEYMPAFGLDKPLITLNTLNRINFFFNAPAPDEFEPIKDLPGQTRELSMDIDTCGLYLFTELEPNSAKATPLDPNRWKCEKPNNRRIRWTYRVTNEDHDEAVRQTLERWKDRPEKQ